MAQCGMANWRWPGSAWYGSLEMAWLSVAWPTGMAWRVREWRGSVELSCGLFFYFLIYFFSSHNTLLEVESPKYIFQNTYKTY